MYETKIGSGDTELKHTIVIENKAYKIPLLGDLPYEDVEKATSGLGGFKTFLEKHLDKKVVAKLSVNQLRTIQNDWATFSRKDMGIKPGES
jgi:hypothetical protein